MEKNTDQARVPSRRRTKRIALNVPLEVSGKDAQNCSFTLRTIATNLNRNGAMIHLNRDLSVGSVIVMQHRRGVRASARVVAQTSRGDCYGVEFLEPDNAQNFWGVIFPPPSQTRRKSR